MKRLFAIQQALHAPKDQNNKFGQFRYRKAEGILEAVKPLLVQEQLCILMNDEVQTFNGENYLYATVGLYANDGKCIASTSAFAKMDKHAGMSAEQATGAASSYARKYALCGLFAIDDSSVDPDALEPQQARLNVASSGRSTKTAAAKTDIMQRVAACNDAAAINALYETMKTATPDEKNAWMAAAQGLSLKWNKEQSKWM